MPGAWTPPDPETKPHSGTMQRTHGLGLLFFQFIHPFCDPGGEQKVGKLRQVAPHLASGGPGVFWLCPVSSPMCLLWEAELEGGIPGLWVLAQNLKVWWHRALATSLSVASAVATPTPGPAVQETRRLLQTLRVRDS